MIEQIIKAPKTDFYIKLASETDLPTVFADFYGQDFERVVDEETGEEALTPVGDKYLLMSTQHYSIDLVGTIYESTGNMLTDDEGNEYPEQAPIDGYHVNVRLSGDAMRETVEAIDSIYGVTPSSPSRVFL